MVSVQRGDVVRFAGGAEGVVQSRSVTLDSCGRPIVSVWTGEFYVPGDVAAIVAVNGVPVADMPQQLSLFGGCDEHLTP